MRRQQEIEREAEIQRNYEEYNQYMRIIGKCVGDSEEQLPSERTEATEDQHEGEKYNEDEENEDEIQFDQMISEAAQENAEFDEDREDDGTFDDEEECLGDSMSYTKTVAMSQEDQMWHFVIQKHGQEEFNSVYAIIEKYKLERFSEQAQRKIQEDVQYALPHVDNIK